MNSQFYIEFERPIIDFVLTPDQKKIVVATSHTVELFDLTSYQRDWVLSSSVFGKEPLWLVVDCEKTATAIVCCSTKDFKKQLIALSEDGGIKWKTSILSSHFQVFGDEIWWCCEDGVGHRQVINNGDIETWQVGSDTFVSTQRGWLVSIEDGVLVSTFQAESEHYSRDLPIELNSGRELRVWFSESGKWAIVEEGIAYYAFSIPDLKCMVPVLISNRPFNASALFTKNDRKIILAGANGGRAINFNNGHGSLEAIEFESTTQVFAFRDSTNSLLLATGSSESQNGVIQEVYLAADNC
ncbi:MAG: hypothetical protein R3C03_07390 [Pirellulaceae bacterium]